MLSLQAYIGDYNFLKRIFLHSANNSKITLEVPNLSFGSLTFNSQNILKLELHFPAKAKFLKVSSRKFFFARSTFLLMVTKVCTLSSMPRNM